MSSEFCRMGKGEGLVVGCVRERTRRKQDERLVVDVWGKKEDSAIARGIWICWQNWKVETKKGGRIAVARAKNMQQPFWSKINAENER